jgi:hypothetical protein
MIFSYSTIRDIVFDLTHASIEIKYFSRIMTKTCLLTFELTAMLTLNKGHRLNKLIIS